MDSGHDSLYSKTLADSIHSLQVFTSFLLKSTIHKMLYRLIIKDLIALFCKQAK
jgi:hypothetical protein